jgi:DNA modification methylase
VIYCAESLEFLKYQSEYSADIIYSDPPYALGSEVIIKENGKVDYKNAVDFMNKWEMPTGEYWEQWFKECYRTLKYGGYCLMFGMDRQLLLFKYYAHLAGFNENQSILWYQIQNFPKSSDLSKNIDKYLGNEREIIGEDLSKKYDGYKYSISPLKQTCETVMVFQKPYKSGSCLYDTLAYENGDVECCCGALNVENNRVPLNSNESNPIGSGKRVFASNQYTEEKKYGDNKITPDNGRYPATTFVNSESAKVLDNQHSDVSGGNIVGGTPQGFGNSKNTFANGCHYKTFNAYNDTGGCSKILHKCDYEKDEYDILNYFSKVNSKERNDGLETENKNSGTGFQKKCSRCGKWLLKQQHSDNYTCHCEEPLIEETKGNNHPTLKPIELNKKILSLFKTPNPQRILYPFAGAGSEIIGGIMAGFDNWDGCEINSQYVEIANKRINYYANKNIESELF